MKTLKLVKSTMLELQYMLWVFLIPDTWTQKRERYEVKMPRKRPSKCCLLHYVIMWEMTLVYHLSDC